MLVLLFCSLSISAASQNNPFESSVPASVLTQHNNIDRTGVNDSESILTTGNVNPSTFGRLFLRAVDGQIYAQPLYVPNVPIPHVGVRNVVYLATDKNTVYAYDADDPAASRPYWQVNLGPCAPWSDFYTPPITDMNESVGITGTPVIDPDRGEIFLVAKTKENGAYYQRLHALNLYTGVEEPHSPVLIAAAVKGKGYDAANGMIVFGAFKQLQRPGLLLNKGMLTICFGSHGDHDPYHGWVMQYRESNLKQANVYCSTPDGAQGAFWMAGQGAAEDTSGNIYVTSGNGDSDARSGGRDYGQSLIKLNFGKRGNPVVDWFTPFNVDVMNKNDTDLGSCGLCLVPGTDLILTGSKQGKLYLVNRTRMGHFHQGDDSQIVEGFQGGWGHVHGSPVVYDDPIKGKCVYVWTENDHLRQYQFVNGTLAQTPIATSTMAVPQGMPGGMLAISTDHGKAGTGIVWATRPFDGNANWLTQEGLLQAFDASDVSRELWNSKMNEARDDMGNFAKFCPPTVANGRVYLATFSNTLAVYGLLPAPGTESTPQPANSSAQR